MYNYKNVRPELESMGFRNLGAVYWNASTPMLYEEIIRRREGHLAHLGPVVVRTGHHVGRSPNDRFIVREPTSEEKVWWGPVNQGIEESRFTNLFYRLLAYLQNKDIFIQDCYAGADPEYRIPIRVITETAWHNLFARNMFIQMREKEEADQHIPQFTIINVPRFYAIPELDDIRSEAFILIHLGKNLVLIGGTSYAGEIKKSVFTMLNYVYPQESVLSMHCSANVGKKGDAALFFGLSGTGKTTLSADPERYLIGDDEHGWSEKGIFNFEGGCYAKVIRLSKEAEPDIYECTRRFGTILENVTLDQNSRRIDLNDNSLTENTRAAYPIPHIPGAIREGVCGHPSNIIMLTCDAFGVMPPVAKLTDEQAVYHFLSGYTAKVAGTEMGIKEPQATFSTCFGAPFMALRPEVYANLFMKKIKTHRPTCWLLNTGWSGRPYGEAARIKIAYSRALIRGILSGDLDKGEFDQDPLFGFMIPRACKDVPSEILNPRVSASDPKEYEERAKRLAYEFVENFKQFGDRVPKGVKEVLNVG
ncbi:MAG: phosphoenolpyruvate carboxykinase (ATP) [Deltaproteobacteria bacterium]|nr:phosphoenolpyruvate carboxykinase (ATP) [Deltaproteobacteria bacterium]MBW1930217.1 phosphoenolpyruvate carboxykinase (ATP) [Deltaproteobacteria bacterium]MBW2024280.1 phosphoenolpyruvate carboxykinase (ATP) [Deltaproteobacteria bacterium]MBW2126073.1 phosphoenolpyruvate carboxykinase (ATP) [Deltaproteobacteria bacterium]RLB24001.1 MAG: phosphoenolpyruvate carboxykinase (ATP) [Deltaproteobacteria bacterium]